MHGNASKQFVIIITKNNRLCIGVCVHLIATVYAVVFAVVAIVLLSLLFSMLLLFMLLVYQCSSWLCVVHVDIGVLFVKLLLCLWPWLSK